MTITGTGHYQGPSGFDRGMQATLYCGNSPESWVRGSATLDTASGNLSMVIQLETDSLTAGPKGKVKVTIRDAEGNSLAIATSQEVSLKGKPPGEFILKNFASSEQIPVEKCQKATSLWVEPECTGSENGTELIDLATLVHTFKILVGAL